MQITLSLFAQKVQRSKDSLHGFFSRNRQAYEQFARRDGKELLIDLAILDSYPELRHPSTFGQGLKPNCRIEELKEGDLVARKTDFRFVVTKIERVGLLFKLHYDHPDTHQPAILKKFGHSMIYRCPQT